MILVGILDLLLEELPQLSLVLFPGYVAVVVLLGIGLVFCARFPSDGVPTNPEHREDGALVQRTTTTTTTTTSASHPLTTPLLSSDDHDEEEAITTTVREEQVIQVHHDPDGTIRTIQTTTMTTTQSSTPRNKEEGSTLGKTLVR